MKEKLLLAACLTACSAASLQAATQSPADTIPSIKLSEVTVVATQATATTPVAFTNLKQDDIAPSNCGPDIPYLLSMTPSLISTSDAGAGVGYTSMSIRGTDGTRINVTANGVPINNPESHKVYWVNMPDLASSLSGIQIQRGAGTSTNGAAAFGATVNMVTASPSREAYGELSGSYGMYNTHKETIRLGTGLKGGHWGADVRLSNIGSDGYIDRASTNLWSYFAQLGYYAQGTSVRLVAFGGKERTYNAWNYATRDEIAKYGRRYNPCGKYTDTEGKTAFYPDQYDNYIQHHFQLLAKQQLSQQLSLDVALHYTKDDGYYEELKTRRTLVEYGLENFTLPDGSVVKKCNLVRRKHNDNHLGGAVASLTWKNERVNTVLGGSINRYSGLHFGRVVWIENYLHPLDPLHEYYSNKGRKTDGNIYLRSDIAILPSLTGYVDLQYRHIDYSITGINDTYDWNTGAMAPLDWKLKYDFFNPKVGLNYTRGYNRVFASWSVAHREPARDNFTDGDPAHTPRAERLFDYELGYSYDNGTIAAGANLYYMDYKDQLVLSGEISDTGNPLTINTPHSYRMGIELQGAWKPTRWFDWQLNLTLSRNRIKDFVEYIYEDEYQNPITRNCGDTPISYSPDVILSNAFNFHYRGFDAALQTRYVSSQYMTNARRADQQIDAYCVSNLMLGYTFKTLGLKEVRAGFTVYNIFNAQYESNGYAGTGYSVNKTTGDKEIYTWSCYAVQAPIHVMGSLTVKF